MDVTTLTKLSKWMESTDLEEVTWAKGDDKISLKINNNPERTNILTSTLEPIISPSIGMFHFSRLGKTNSIKENDTVVAGQELGVIEIGKNFESVITKSAGVIKLISIEDGKPVEYGQPLFFLEPKQ